MPIKARRPLRRRDKDQYGHFISDANNNFYEDIYENYINPDEHLISEIPHTWLNRLLPATGITFRCFTPFTMNSGFLIIEKKERNTRMYDQIDC